MKYHNYDIRHYLLEVIKDRAELVKATSDQMESSLIYLNLSLQNVLDKSMYYYIDFEFLDAISNIVKLKPSDILAQAEVSRKLDGYEESL